ncbi:hypothetical protein [Saccharospirillum sp.]|uniref:hypothetical protein n=1 Tax=Saccharospirillum sp. TaxID=2033801 RepID=UPI0034A03F35
MGYVDFTQIGTKTDHSPAGDPLMKHNPEHPEPEDAGERRAARAVIAAPAIPAMRPPAIPCP